LVASAVGLDTARGDVITLRSLPFEPLPQLGTEAVAGSAGLPINLMQLIQIGVLAAVALILGLFVVRPVMASGSNSIALPAPDTIEGTAELGGFEMNTEPMSFEMADTPALAPPSNDAVARLRQMITEREVETVQILQEWMADPDKKEPV
jgi:flagellar M-ring protein FliF